MPLTSVSRRRLCLDVSFDTGIERDGLVDSEDFDHDATKISTTIPGHR